jgi:hypothetical protein
MWTLSSGPIMYGAAQEVAEFAVGAAERGNHRRVR